MNGFLQTALGAVAMLCLLSLAPPLRADDCIGPNGTAQYDPTTQGCCGGQVYDLGTQGCCSGYDAMGSPFAMVYDLSSQVCYSLQCGAGPVMAGVAPAGHSPQCCGTTTYDPVTQGCGNGLVYTLGSQAVCSDGTGNQSVYDTGTQGCCNGVVFDLATQECCGNLVVPLGQCCSGLPFNPETQTCCTDGHIASIGQCDPPPMCNNVPFDPVTQECCGSVIVPLGRCCNGASYDPGSQGCCSGSVYTLASQSCCGGTVYELNHFAGQFGCCNGQPYDVTNSGQGCCNGGLYDLLVNTCCDGLLLDPWMSCCGGSLPFDPALYDCCGDSALAPKGQCGWLVCGNVPYDPATHGCCDGSLYTLGSQECCGWTVVSAGNCCNNIPINPLLQGCCNNVTYDLLTQECCGGIIVPAGGCCNGVPLEPGYGCCNNAPYDLMLSDCCGNGLVAKGHCCNGVEFDPGTQGCCQGQVYTLSGNECCTDGRVVPSGQCGWPTCAGNPYDDATHGCCNGTLYERATQDCCNGGQVYSLGTQTCCDGGAVVANGEPCPPPPQFCGGTLYDPNLGQGCCNGQVYSTYSSCCVNNRIVDMTPSGQCPSMCGESAYDPATQDCCNGQVYDKSTHTCCGSVPVPYGYCCNGQTPYDPASQECCGDYTVAPTGQCGWPVCGGGRYDPNSGLACCNGETYDPATQVCCDGATVVDIGMCHPSFCNNVPFDPGLSECCNGQIVSLGSCCGNQIIDPGVYGCCGQKPNDQPYLLDTHGCSNGQIYNKTTHKTCPDGRIIPIEADCEWTTTCNGIPFNNMTHECCSDGTLALIGQCPTPPQLCGDTPYDTLTQGCCSGHIYTLASQDCCGDGAVLPKGQCDWPRCNGDPYNPNTQECCAGTLITAKGNCPTCAGTPYDPRYTGCCQNQRTYNFDTEDCCGDGSVVAKGMCPQPCGEGTYDPATQICCPTGHIVDIGQPCPSVCGSQTYDPMQKMCCGGQLYDLPTDQVCCYGEMVSPGNCPDLTVTIISSCQSPCLVSTNQTTTVSATSEGALGEVTYSWDFGGATLSDDETDSSGIVINAAGSSGAQGGASHTLDFKNVPPGTVVVITVTATDSFYRNGSIVQRSASHSFTVMVLKVSLTVDGVEEAKKTDPGALVVRNHDNNNAPRVKVTLEQVLPATWQGNVVLSKNNSNIKVYDSATGGTELTFNGTDNKFSNTSDLPKDLYVEGATASTSMRDVELSLQAENNSTSSDTAKFTVLWVDQPTVAVAGSVSDDNDKKDEYKLSTAANTYNLGLQAFIGNPDDGSHWGWGFESRANVHPSGFDYPNSDLTFERDVESRAWKGNGQESLPGGKDFFPSIPPGNDTAAPFNDANPEPNGKIYDFDGPGLVIMNAPQNEIRRSRHNFKTFASITVCGQSVRCSPVRNHYVRFSMKQLNAPSGINWQIIDPPDVQNDKQAGDGSTPLSWNLE